MKFLKLLVRYLGRGIEHLVHRALVLGEGDNLPDSLRPSEDHHQPIDPRGDAAVGRSTVFESLKKVSETRLNLLLSISQQPEDFLLKLPCMDPYTSAGKLAAITDNIIVPGMHPFRRAIQQGHILISRCSKWMMHRLPSATFSPLE